MALRNALGISNTIFAFTCLFQNKSDYNKYLYESDNCIKPYILETVTYSNLNFFQVIEGKLKC